jgi:cytochrome b561
MSDTTHRHDRYSLGQIVLHWAVLALVVVQLLSHEAMEEAFDEPGLAKAAIGDDPMAMVHAVSGLAVLVLMLLRIVLRLRFGAPALPEDMPQIQKLAAHASHLALYGLLLLIPLAGLTAVAFGSEDMGDVHGTLVTLLWIVLALHIAGALYHAFFRRDGVFQRILPSR